MAGTQQLQNPKDGTLTTKKEQWQIHYSRFFNFPSLPSSTCPTLMPRKKDNTFGVWLSASSVASVQLIFDQNARGMVLTVTFKGKIYEEHYISKLVFTWPQVSCLEACPVRGSRVVFASYRDGLGQVQKFAMRFSALSDSQTFMCILKESLKDIRNVELPSNKLGSDVSPPSKFFSSSGIHDRAAEQLSNASPVGIQECPIQSLSNIGSMHYTCLEATALAHDSEAASATLPPSFSALLSDTCMDAKQEPATVPMTHDSQMMDCMTDSSFNDMLSKLETAILELGGDLSL